MKNIRARDLLCGMIVFLQGSTLLINITAENLGHEAYIAQLAATILGIPVLIFYSKVFRWGSMFDVCKSSFGRVFGKIITLLYIIFFVILCGYNINLLASFISGYVLEETPKLAFIILFTALCAFAAKGGAENVLRIATLFLTASFASEIFNIFLLRENMSAYNFLPLFDQTPAKYAKGIASRILISAGEALAFFCFVSFDKSKKTSLIWGYIIGGMLLLVVLLRTIASLGGFVSISTYPTYEALRLINSKNTLARVETTSTFTMLAMIFFKVSVIYSGAIEGVKKLAGFKQATFPALGLGIVILILANTLFESGADALHFGAKYGFLAVLPFALLIPAALYIKSKK